MKINIPKGTRDILPSESEKYRYIKETYTNICKTFGYGEIITPVFESTNLFSRGVGDTTDIVQKEMYTFNDKGNRSMTLRPEGTAGVVRSYIEKGMSSTPQPTKLFYMEKMYRYENVQKGRYREFSQLGLEVFGSNSPSVDVEVLGLLNMFYSKLGLDNIDLRINSIGCPVCREKYNKELLEYFKPKLDVLCEDCNNRYLKNPLRIIDCKNDSCQKATNDVPYLIDNLCEECNESFASVKKGLNSLGIEYTVDKKIVRGLDYYTKTVFEFVSNNVGTQGTICGGGRYDGLVELLGGKATPGIGFAMGLERLIMELEARDLIKENTNYPVIFFATLGDDAKEFATKLVYKLRDTAIYTEIDIMDRSLKAQMKYANKINAKYCVVLGDDEISSNKCKVKIMESGEEKEISVDSIYNRIVEGKV